MGGEGHDGSAVVRRECKHHALSFAGTPILFPGNSELWASAQILASQFPTEKTPASDRG